MEQDHSKVSDRVHESRASDLIVRASHGNLQAIDELLELYAKRINRWCAQLTRYNYGRWESNWKDHDDLMQQVMFQIFVTLPKAQTKFDNEEDFDKWVRRIARNLAIDGWRRSNRESARRDERPSEEFENLASKSSSRADEISEELLAGLSEEDREMVILKFVEGRNTREIAEILGTNHTRVARHLLKALDSLRTLLDSDGQ